MLKILCEVSYSLVGFGDYHLILPFLLCHQVFLAEMKEEDKVIGESQHTISKGIRNKVLI